MPSAPGRARWDVRLAECALRNGRPGLAADKWQQAIDPSQSGAWEQRLSWDGLSEAVVAEEPAVRTRVSPEVAAWISEARPVATDVASEIPFADLWHPIAAAAWLEVEGRGLRAVVTASARQDLRQALVRRLSGLTAQPLSHLMVGDRTLVDVALAHLSQGGEVGSSRSTYGKFCEEMLNAQLEPLFGAFPVLARLVDVVLQHWITASIEMLQRIADDRDRLRTSFSIEPDDPIASIELDLSDPHRGGRSVAVLRFMSGRRLVYKPRSVQLEERYQHLVSQISPHFGPTGLRHLQVLTLDGYGYMEHAQASPPREPTDVAQFYVNAGRVLAVLYVLGATDCHWENMIAVDDQLLLIDAETLLEGTPVALAERLPSEAGSQLADSMARSVLRTGMLPAWISVSPGRSIDISTLGAPGTTAEPVIAPDWCFVNTDDMVWGEREVQVRHPTCLPVPAGEENPLRHHAEDLLRGFRDGVEVLSRDEVRELARSVLLTFRGMRRRVVVRATRTYVLLQEQAIDLEALRNEDARALCLELLTRAYLLGEERPTTWPLLRQELAAMEKLDVPYFESIVGRRDVVLGTQCIVQDYYERDGLEEALDRLDDLTTADADWQCRLISGAMAAHRFEMNQAKEATGTASVPDEGPTPSSAESVARLLADEVLDDPAGPPTWLTVALLADATRVQLGLVPPGLYDGRAGIAAFLYDCGRDELADAVIQPVHEALTQRQAVQVTRFMRDVGNGMAGTGGILRLFQHRASVSDDGSSWRDRSRHVIDRLSSGALEADQASDLVSGIAGLAAPLAALHSTDTSRHTAELLRCIGDLLLDRQQESGGWLLAPGHPALVGFSHGAAGVATALAEISVALGEDRYASAAARAVEFEETLFDEPSRNWPDLRRGISHTNRLMMRAWCHGSVGVALARLRLLALLPDHPDATKWKGQLQVAVDGSLDAPLTPVDHLCCGNLGRAVVAVLAGQQTNNLSWVRQGTDLMDLVDSLAAGSPERYRLLLGIDGASGLRLPGLMTGLAGVGMVRLHGAHLAWANTLLV